MYFIKKMTGCTYRFIGDYFGGKNHATVIHAENLIKDFIKVDFQVREECKELDIEIYKKVNLKQDKIKLTISNINDKLALFSIEKLIKIQNILSNKA